MRELAVGDAYEITADQHRDDRGLFMEWYRFDVLAETVGHPLELRQGNLSVSRKMTVRGIHFADTPPGQAKYVTAVHGAVRDYVVDIRVGSPTFGTWDAIDLDDQTRSAAYVAEGIGHCFVALTDDAVVTYLVSGVYDPQHEHGINPLDPEIGLEFPFDHDQLIVSQKDRDAPGLRAAADSGLLPDYAQLQEFYASLGGPSVIGGAA